MINSSDASDFISVISEKHFKKVAQQLSVLGVLHHLETNKLLTFAKQKAKTFSIKSNSRTSKSKEESENKRLLSFIKSESHPRKVSARNPISRIAKAVELDPLERIIRNEIVKTVAEKGGYGETVKNRKVLIKSGENTNKVRIINEKIDLLASHLYSFVQSSNLLAVAYNSKTNTMEIEFRNGGVYRYYLVPEKVYKALLNAGSKGTYFWNNIRKPNKLNFRRIRFYR